MKSLEARLKAIKASDDQAVLLQALDDRSHLIIEAAARRLHRPATVGALLQTYRRLHAAGAKGDPGCWARVALLETLGGLEVPEAAEAARLAVHTVQVERISFGPADTATGLRVAAAAVLANLRVEGALIDLGLLLFDSEPNAPCSAAEAPYAKAATRSAAARAIGALGDPGGAALLAVKLARPAGELNEILGECMDALVTLPEPRAVELLRPWLASGDEYLVAVAATNLARAGGSAVLEELARAADSVLPAARAAVVYALASIRADGTLTALRRLADHADDAVRHAARSFLSPE